MTDPLRYIPARVRRQVLDANCAYCGGPFPTEVDHVIPVAQGGSGDLSNLAAACEPCNREKLDFTPAEWRAWRESEGLPWPPPGRIGYIREAVQQVLDSGVSPSDLAEAAAAYARRDAS
ncbi:HNH endonuclease signature motif containing protein [Streptomyces sp. M41(2017)]|uniref:HNH endonuclease n=1 Tax=Streptomyces sp. M41(2017) TaxID=1955065 RepID=UPI0019D47C49|nr:HNH endonuclease signature motif containing protein [Streptomyces sp. M41(2017)]